MNPFSNQNPTSKPEPVYQSAGSFFKDILKFAIISIIIVFPIRAFVAEPFIVSGSSMDPTFKTGNYLIIDRLSYKFEEPARGDVIIFKYPKDTTKYFIKRVIGLPGEKVEMRGDNVIITNKENPEGLTLKEPYIDPDNQKAENFVITLGPNDYFVMGDNRIASADSRVWGTLPRDLIVGRALIRAFPVSKAAIFPGKDSSN